LNRPLIDVGTHDVDLASGANTSGLVPPVSTRTISSVIDSL
jgi:hypothetical protein